MMMKWKTNLVVSLLAVAMVSGCQVVTTPTPGSSEPSQYKVVINVTAQDETYINAYVYDGTGSMVVTGTVSVDGTSVPVMPGSTIRWVNLGTVWADGSSHSYSVTTADGKTVTGTMVKPVGTVAGVSYSPSKVIANEYTVSPPAGGWPAGTYIKAMVRTGTGGYYSIDTYPVGSDVKSVPILFTGKTEVTFTACLVSTATVAGYTAGSQVTVAGTATSW